MLKKTVTYEDFNGQEITEDFYFHLSKAELLEMEMSEKDGFAAAMRRIVAANDGKGIVDTFKWIILKAYGEKSPDGKRFIKSAELRDAFEQHAAYSDMFIEFATDANAAAEFINGIVPSGSEQNPEEIAKQIEELQGKAVETAKAPVMEGDSQDISAETEKTPGEKPLEAYSRQELLSMSQADFQKIAGTDPKSMDRRILEVAMQRKNQTKTEE